MQEKFADIEVSWGPKLRGDHLANGDAKRNGPQKVNVVEALLKLTLEPAPIHLLDARLAACECMKAFFAKHPGIRLHVLRRAIDGHMSGDDQIPNVLSILVEPPESRRNADPYQTWMASVLMFHLVFEDPEAKAVALKVTEGDAESGEEVITCVQSIAGNLITGIHRGDDERISVGYLMLLCGWLFEDPDAVNDFLGEGSSVQSLIQETKQRGVSSVLLPGLCSVLLGIIYEFSTKDSPIPRATLHQLLLNGLGREQYIDKITKLREFPLVRDFEVLPQTSQGEFDGGLPDVFFDRTFMEFLKDNFSRLIRAIDRDPGFEVPVIANGIQKGISRELVDSLRAEVDERNQTIQKLESDLVTLERKLEQEQLDHRKTRDSCALELSRIKQINETLQRNHEEELSELVERHEKAKNELLKQHDEQLRAVDNRLKETAADYERKCNSIRERHEAEVAELKKTIESLQSDYETRSNSVRERHEAEVAELKRTIQSLESNLDKASKEHAQSLKAAHEEYSSKNSALEERASRAEERAKAAEERAREAEEALKKAQAALEKAQAEVQEKEKARKAVQEELDDLLIVFGDLEAKRKEDKVGINPSPLPILLDIVAD